VWPPFSSLPAARPSLCALDMAQVLLLASSCYHLRPNLPLHPEQHFEEGHGAGGFCTALPLTLITEIPLPQDFFSPPTAASRLPGHTGMPLTSLVWFLPRKAMKTLPGGCHRLGQEDCHCLWAGHGDLTTSTVTDGTTVFSSTGAQCFYYSTLSCWMSKWVWRWEEEERRAWRRQPRISMHAKARRQASLCLSDARRTLTLAPPCLCLPTCSAAVSLQRRLRTGRRLSLFSASYSCHGILTWRCALSRNGMRTSYVF